MSLPACPASPAYARDQSLLSELGDHASEPIGARPGKPFGQVRDRKRALDLLQHHLPDLFIESPLPGHGLVTRDGFHHELRRRRDSSQREGNEKLVRPRIGGFPVPCENDREPRMHCREFAKDTRQVSPPAIARQVARGRGSLGIPLR